jgi:hypothetical protein
MDIDLNKIILNIKKGLYKRIGKGSGRVVFDLEDGTVLKAAWNKKGLAQNEAEVDIVTSSNNDIFAKIIYMSDDFRYLIMQKAEKIKDMSYVWEYFDVKNNHQLYHTKEIEEITEKYEMMKGDLGRAASWGIISHRPVIIDYGFTKQVRRKYY